MKTLVISLAKYLNNERIKKDVEKTMRMMMVRVRNVDQFKFFGRIFMKIKEKLINMEEL